jgi:hypothetical protein
MKIVYTNLQENDSGIKRSVRQFQVDFGRTPDRRDPVGQGRLRDERKSARDTLLSYDALSTRRRRLGTIENGSEGWDEGGANPQAVVLQGLSLRGLQTVTSLAGVYIRKFVETQMRTVESLQDRNRIDILV